MALHLHYGILFGNKILSFAIACIELESITLSEISHTEKEIQYDFTFMRELKKRKNKQN